MRIAVVVGTRPEFIKTWSVVKEIKRRSNLELVLIHTGQHYDYEMSQVFFEELSLEKPDFFLEVGAQPVVEQSTAVMKKLSDVLLREKIDFVLVQGDTNSCLSAAIVTAQLRIPLGHIEAGCRSFDRTMPEEFNRIVIDSIANLLFAPSEVAFQNLMREGHTRNRVLLAGNTAVDALNEGLRILSSPKEGLEKPYCVITIHRAGNTDNPARLSEILKALRDLKMKCIFPIHPRTRKMIKEFDMEDLLLSSNLEIIAPLGYLSFLNLIRNASLVLTDSGGVQEEAALLSVHTITIRENTEWPETVWAGINHLAHADAREIIQIADTIQKNSKPQIGSIYKGDAGKNIVDLIVSRMLNEEMEYKIPDMIKSGYPILGLVDRDDSSALMRFDKNGKTIFEGKAKYSIIEKYRPLEKE
ncbi:MAG: non-hydrolyzing UDP-N-acetylglucosamine 2-epimerase [Candidatus Thorarchaeota archaeon]